MIDHLSGMRWAPGGHLRVKGREKKEREKEERREVGEEIDWFIHSKKYA